IEHAAREIYERKIGCLPVVADGELVGIITSQDMMRIMIEMVGAHGSGSWVEVEVPNQPGTLANVTDVIRERQVNIAGVFLTPAPRASNRLIVLRLETTNPTGVVRSLEEAGFKVTTVESSTPWSRRSRNREIEHLSTLGLATSLVSTLAPWRSPASQLTSCSALALRGVSRNHFRNHFRQRLWRALPSNEARST
ncbi:MAG: ACT domain-containing protein, partial [Actinomycetota bacterium]|nr:ACT domain-containing protein [Actinomycetota bacterium]